MGQGVGLENSIRWLWRVGYGTTKVQKFEILKHTKKKIRVRNEYGGELLIDREDSSYQPSEFLAAARAIEWELKHIEFLSHCISRGRSRMNELTSYLESVR